MIDLSDGSFVCRVEMVRDGIPYGHTFRFDGREGFMPDDPIITQGISRIIGDMRSSIEHTEAKPEAEREQHREFWRRTVAAMEDGSYWGDEEGATP